MVLDGIMARQIHLLDKDEPGPSQFVGLAVLIALVSIISCFVVDGLMGILWKPGDDSKFVVLMLCRALLEDSTSIYAVSRVGGIEAIGIAEVSLVFSLIVFFILSLGMLYVLSMEISDMKGSEFCFALFAGLLMCSVPIANCAVGISCWYGVAAMPTGVYVIELLAGIGLLIFSVANGN